MKPKFQLGQRVWHTVDREARGMVTGITQRCGWYVYLVTWDDREEKPHYDIELSGEPVNEFAD